MTASGFYHLTRTGALDALPRLLGRTLAGGQRAMVVCGKAVDMLAVSEALWESQVPDWLPHGSEDAHAGRPEWQPIWLARMPAASSAPLAAPNGARYLFLVGNASHLPGFDRIFDLFDGKNEGALREARQRWSTAKSAGHQLTYWQQGERGWGATA